MAQGKSPTRKKLLLLVKGLADPMKWNWGQQNISARDAADAVLWEMVKLGLIGHRQHPSGGHVWIINGQYFGRTDDVPQCFAKK